MNLTQLQAQAAQLGITENDVAQIGNTRYKTTWAEAIRLKRLLNAEEIRLQEALDAEAAAENKAAEAKRQAAKAAEAYNSPSAAVVVPIAFAAAVGTTFLKGVAGTVELLARR
jgi:plasmid maintenance system antidote protein VapI